MVHGGMCSTSKHAMDSRKSSSGNRGSLKIASCQWSIEGVQRQGKGDLQASQDVSLLHLKWRISVIDDSTDQRPLLALELLHDPSHSLVHEAGSFHFRISIVNPALHEQSITVDATYPFSVGKRWTSTALQLSSPHSHLWTDVFAWGLSTALLGDLIMLQDPFELSVREHLSPTISLGLPHSDLLHNLEIISAHPLVVVIECFLTPIECNQLIQLASPLLKRSLVAGKKVTHNRTSESMFMTGALESHPTVVSVVRKVFFYARILGFNIVEDHHKLQVIRYKTGQEFKPHYDNEAGECHKRALTMLMFLTNVADGGETFFPRGTPLKKKKSPQSDSGAGIAVKPQKGRALLFWSRRPDGNEDPLSIHGGKKVMKGEKWIASKWLTATC